MDRTLLIQLFLSFALGLLIGFQREWAAKKVAGVRTYPLIAVLGTLSVVIGREFGGWIVAVALLAVAAFLLMGTVQEFRKGNQDTGITSEVAALVMFGVGCAIGMELYRVGLIVTGATAVLLHWKTPMHEFVRRVGKEDLNAIFRLVLVAMVIQPMLPNRTYGPFAVLNPFDIWLMVSLIVGISLTAYLAYKVFGRRGGTILTGILGGFISSTATTLSYARAARKSPGTETLGAAIILIASAIVVVRVLFEIAVVAPEYLSAAGPPLIALLGFTVLIAAAVSSAGLQGEKQEPPRETPADLRAAVLFGLLYAGVLFAVELARHYFGTSGLYAVAALSGLTDMDAITLSTCQLVKSGHVEAGDGWRMIVVGMLSNLGFKGLAVAVLGNRRLFVRVAAAFALIAAAAGLLIAFWP